MYCTLLPMLLSSLCLGEGSLPDLTRIERRVGPEPAYQGQPKYLLIVFGPAARTKVWLAFDGDTLHYTGDGKRSLADPASKAPPPLVQVNGPDKQRVYANLPITEMDGVTKHQLTVNVKEPGGAITLDVQGPRVQYTGGIDSGELVPAAGAADAAIVHFGGALVPVVGQRYWPSTLIVESGKPDAGPHLYFQVKLATPGLGKGTYASINPALYNATINDRESFGPNGLAIEVRLPAAQAGQPPVIARGFLRLTCCAGIYSGGIPVPEGLGPGTAQAVISFPGSSPGLVLEKTERFDFNPVSAKQ